ncbi:hypothetical protein GOODEAATRI_013152 [Goodea atripinnis]|uniref:Band 7 domain-containing protein n=1 Tax=Goodea atripinnis TaxID=208336 RepID=A0ABV0NJV2_9TELE
MNTVVLFVPQQEAWVVERMGRYHRILEPGLNFLIPVLDKIRYVQSLKEIVIDVPEQSAVSLGEAQAVVAKAEAKAKAIRLVSDALTEQAMTIYSTLAKTTPATSVEAAQVKKEELPDFLVSPEEQRTQ